MQPIPAYNSFRSEAQLQPELQVTRVESAAGLSESRIPNAVMELAFSTGQFEVRVIQDVEAFCSKFELRSLRDLDVFEERRIPCHETRTGERVTAEGSSVSRLRPLEDTVVGNVWILVIAEITTPAISPHVMSSPTEAGNGGIRTIVCLEIVVVVTTPT